MSIRDIITPDFVKNVYALGVDLTLDDGSPFPDELYEQAIESSVSALEAELGICIDPFKVQGERHDATVQDKDAFYPFCLDHRPVRSVSALQILFGNATAADLPVSWAVVSSPQAGQINLIPTAGALGSFFIRSGVPLVLGDAFSPYRYIPAYFNVDYEAGFYFEDGVATLPLGEREVEVQLTSPTVGERIYHNLVISDAMGATDIKVRRAGTNSFVISAKTAPTDGDVAIAWTAHTVDPLLIKAIAMMAAIAPLDIAGDLIAGAGVSQYSIGVDGLSQSVATTASATSAGYGARIISYQKQLQGTISALKAKYRFINTFSM